ncbi:MAG: hypothetical protein DWQ07_11665 [Chloroflexi bacterium]|nr:MAG: hypothetical protein DWQ07_11665 [Chloroflexota bacterium]MBL1197137.1 hypothetical protein [Chloroflexota bacterium]NOH14432.1 hypothetical protein [Chloroflexota bacterium]
MAKRVTVTEEAFDDAITEYWSFLDRQYGFQITKKSKKHYEALGRTTRLSLSHWKAEVEIFIGPCQEFSDRVFDETGKRLRNIEVRVVADKLFPEAEFLNETVWNDQELIEALSSIANLVRSRLSFLLEADYEVWLETTKRLKS